VSAWLFIGTNSTFRDSNNGVPGTHYPLDVGEAAASYSGTSHWTVSEPYNTSTTSVLSSGAPLASILLCDPNINMSSAYVTFTAENNTISISPWAIPSRVGNISPGSAADVLAQSLLGATAIDSEYSDPVLNIVSASIFLQKPLEGFYSYDRTEYVRSATNISSIIGSYVSSASKAWSDGFNAPRSFSTMSLDAIKDQPMLALVGSGPLTITTGILVIMVLVLVVPELWLPVGEPLGIASLKKALKFEKAQT
jgi:hypothetical protein